MSSSSHLPLTSTLIIVAALAGSGIATSALVTLPATVNAASDADATPVYTDFSTFKPIAGPITVVTPGATPTAPPEKISANGHDYFYNYTSGKRLLYLPIARAYQQKGSQHDDTVAQIAASDLAKAIQADSVLRPDNTANNKAFTDAGLVAKGGSVETFNPDPSAVKWTDEVVANRITASFPKAQPVTASQLVGCQVANLSPTSTTQQNLPSRVRTPTPFPTKPSMASRSSQTIK